MRSYTLKPLEVYSKRKGKRKNSLNVSWNNLSISIFFLHFSILSNTGIEAISMYNHHDVTMKSVTNTVLIYPPETSNIPSFVLFPWVHVLTIQRLSPWICLSQQLSWLLHIPIFYLLIKKNANPINEYAFIAPVDVISEWHKKWTTPSLC